MLRRIRTVLGSLAILSLGVVLVWSADADPKAKPAKKPDGEKQANEFMREKLAAAQKVLEGIVTEDFDLIETGSEKMLLMSKAAGWQIEHGPIYAADSAEFARAAERLLKNAKQKNLDASTLSYLHLTMTCVGCHNRIRGTRLAASEDGAISELALQVKIVPAGADSHQLSGRGG